MSSPPRSSDGDASLQAVLPSGLIDRQPNGSSQMPPLTASYDHAYHRYSDDDSHRSSSSTTADAHSILLADSSDSYGSVVPRVQPFAARPDELDDLDPEALLLVREVDLSLRESLPASSSATSSSSSAPDSPEALLRRFGSYDVRLASFVARPWPHTASSHPKLSAAKLAACGFFAHTSDDGSCPLDCVMCYACGVELCEFDAGDEPEASHRQARSDTGVPCAFLSALDEVRYAQMFGTKSLAPAASSSVHSVSALTSHVPHDHQQHDHHHAIDIRESPSESPSSHIDASLLHTHSPSERRMLDLCETAAELSRPVRATCGAAIVVDEMRITANERLTALSPPLVVQLRDPLQSFTEGSESTTASVTHKSFYFQVRIRRLTPPTTVPPVSADTAIGVPPRLVTGSDLRAPLLAQHSSCASPTSSGVSPPPLTIGLSTIPLHARSRPPGFDVPQNGVSIGITSCGDLHLNGQGPMSGIVAMQSRPFWYADNEEGDRYDIAGWRAGDVIGCRVDTQQGIIEWHRNGQSLGPVVIPLQPPTGEVFPSSTATSSDPSSWNWYPTVSLAHPDDEIEFELYSPDPSFDRFSPPSPRRVVSLFESWSLSSIDASCQRSVQVLQESQADLGLGLDQTTAVQRGIGSSRTDPIVVSKVLPGSSAALAGLRVDDQLVGINGKETPLLKDAIAMARARPATVLHIEIRRRSRRFILPLTLGAKLMKPGVFGPLARWAQLSQREMEWVGPPVCAPPSSATPLGRDPSTATTATSLSQPPTYIAPVESQTRLASVRALDAALVVEQRMASLPPSSLCLPSSRTLAARTRSFEYRMQSWRTATSDSGSGTFLSPVLVATHGFVYAPVDGFADRVMCFCCGAIVSDAHTVQEMVAAHRTHAARKKGDVQRRDPFASSSSYHQHDSSEDAGCVFLAMYDVAIGTSTPDRGADVVINVDADGWSSTPALALAPGGPTGGARRISRTPPSRKQLPGPVTSNTDNLARDSPGTSPPRHTHSAMTDSMPSESMPPEYYTAAASPTIAIGPTEDSSNVFEVRDQGVVWSSPVLASAISARSGEFTAGSVDMYGRLPLTESELLLRRAGQGARNYPYRGPGYIHPGDAAAASPPPAPRVPPLTALREFFFGGNPIFLICKVPFFILVLPLFLVWELGKAIGRCLAACCAALGRACERCCDACGRACEWCCSGLWRVCNTFWDFLCCTVLYKTILRPIYRATVYVCTPIADCCVAVCIQLEQCCSYVCGQIGACCAWIGRTFCEPIGAGISACCSAIGRCCSATCGAISRCCSAICDAIGRCCVCFWTPIGKGVSYICSSLAQCASAVCDGLATCCGWICKQIGILCRNVWRCIDLVIWRPIVWIAKKLWLGISLFVEYLIVRPIKALYSCVSAVCGLFWTYILAPIGRGISYVASAIGSCIVAIGGAVWAALSAIGGAIWAVLSAIADGVGSVLRAIYDGLLAPIGRAVASAGRAIAGLCG